MIMLPEWINWLFGKNGLDVCFQSTALQLSRIAGKIPVSARMPSKDIDLSFTDLLYVIRMSMETITKKDGYN